MQFKIEKKMKDGLGRAGVLKTAHGVIHTPAFVPVGTKATVKSLTTEAVRDVGAEVVLANTYHLYLQPGDEIVRKAGGLGKFMNWQGPTMTDSGGFQVFSLGVAYGKDPEGKSTSYGARISKVMNINDLSSVVPERPAPYQAGGFGSGFDDALAPRLANIGADGVSFKSHLDGSIHYITPEKSIQIQHNLGADIIFAFDECTSPAEETRYQEEALERTHRWAKRSLDFHKSKNTNQALFGIVQGGRDENLRKKSAKFMASLNVGDDLDPKQFDGFGIGGSFAKEDMQSAVKWVNE
ncbi:MAG: tRNA guanosine(34) transglycosylase Tgt, partial [Patescibacteria group bacterium]